MLKVYTIYSILFIVFLILIIVTAFITVALTYFQLAVEDHRWVQLPDSSAYAHALAGQGVSLEGLPKAKDRSIAVLHCTVRSARLHLARTGAQAGHSHHEAMLPLLSHQHHQGAFDGFRPLTRAATLPPWSGGGGARSCAVAQPAC